MDEQAVHSNHLATFSGDGLGQIDSAGFDAFKGKKAKLEVAEVISYSKLLEAEGKKLSKEDRKLLDEVLAKDGYLLRVEVKDGEGKRLNRFTIFVAARGSDVKVVGIKD